MIFTQPNSLARLMHQLVDQLTCGQVMTLTFATEAEVRQGLTALHEVAQSRRVGVQVTPTGPHTIELRLVAEAA